MSGGYIPYHLRYNKAVERQAFIELLQRLTRYNPIHDYTYISFGGPFLEDFKIMHNHFDIQKMICIEADENVHKRQQFNKPLKCIECTHATSNEFIEEYEFGEDKTILWLDYTNPKALNEQLIEFTDAILKSDSGDILKITLNAHPESICKNNKVGTELLKQRMSVLKERISTFFPKDKIDVSMFDGKNYPLTLLKILEYASKSTLRNSGYLFFPLTSFVYSDTTQMLTLTGIILKNEDIEQFLQTTAVDQLNFFLGGYKQDEEWGKPLLISIPYLSVKEKLHIDEKIPFSEGIESLNESLGFHFDEDFERSQKMIENYVKYYRQYPQFSRIII